MPGKQRKILWFFSRKRQKTIVTFWTADYNENTLEIKQEEATYEATNHIRHADLVSDRDSADANRH